MSKNQQLPVILLTAMNLRLAVTAITPLFPAIQRTLHVSGSFTALLVTLPLGCFALGAGLAPWLRRTFGVRPLVQAANGLLVLANLLRPHNGYTLLGGTICIGLAIALLNVLVPVMIAQTTTGPAAATRLTSYYAVTMNVVAAAGTALAIPLAQLMGWATVLRLWALPAILAFAASLLPTQAQPHTVPEPATPAHARRWYHLVPDKQTRVLTLFMGLQSLVYYSLIAWLPTIFQALGAPAGLSGTLLAVFQIVGIPAALVLNRVTNERHLLRWLATGYFSGMLLLLWSGMGWWLAASILGFTGSLIFSLALSLIATSSQSVTQVATRSAYAQALGYLLAAIGPMIFGWLQTGLHSWLGGGFLFLALMGLTITSGHQVLVQKMGPHA